MFSAWLDAQAEQALTGAVREIEAASATEVAIAVRRSARSWPHIPVTVGIVTGSAALAFMLFGDPVFPLISFLLDPLLVGVIAGGLAGLLKWPVRFFTTASARREAATRAARAAFVARGVHRTSGRTGVLIYCALAERVAVVIPDVGIERAVPESTITAWEDRIREAIARGGVATAEAIAAMTSTLAAAVPRSADDVNELRDTIDEGQDRRPRS